MTEAPGRKCPFVTFYSFKGGVGRSMALINVASILASRGFRVLVIDMDLEAPGISYLANLGNTGRLGSLGGGDASGPPKESGLQAGVLECLLDAVERQGDSNLFGAPPERALEPYFTDYALPQQTAPLEDDDAEEPLEATEDPYRQDGALYIMPAGGLDNGYARRLAELDLSGLYRSGAGLPLMEDFKKVVVSSGRFDLVLVDSRTGFSDESGICTRDLADHLIVVSGLNQQNVTGTAQFLAALRRSTDDPPGVDIVLSPIPNGEDALVDVREAAAREAFAAAWGTELPIKLRIPYHPQLALTEEPHIFRRRHGYLYEAYASLERRVRHGVDDTEARWTGLAVAAAQSDNLPELKSALTGLRRVARSRHWATAVALRLTREPKLQTAALDEFARLAPFVGRDARAAVASQAGFLAVARIEEEVEAAEKLFELAIIMAPDSAHHLGSLAASNLGNFALFLRKERRDLDRAESLYERAIEADPKNAINLGNFAVFLCDERRDLDRAEALFERAIEADPKHANNLGNFASFLRNERRDLDRAESLYERAIEGDPKNAINLGNFANFLCDERRDLDRAESLYERAIEADPKNAINLGNFANFLCDERRDLDRAESLYERAIEADPKNAHSLSNFANFLCNERRDLDRADPLYERAIEADPKNASSLSNFANFLCDERRSLDRAESLYERAIEADPKNAHSLGNFANFLCDERRDLDRAESLYERAVEADPKDANNLGNFGRLKLIRGDRHAGLAMVEQALQIVTETGQEADALVVELWMYLFCCAAEGRRTAALTRLTELVADGITTGDWDFSQVVARAHEDGHPEAAWLERLVEVLADGEDVEQLESWPAWQAAKLSRS